MIPLPLHTKSLKPSSLASIFSSISTLGVADLPKPIPALVPDLEDLRRDLAIRRGHDPPSSDQPTDSHAADIADESEEKGETKEDDETKQKGGEVEHNEKGGEEIEKETIYMGIVTSDSTVVYYKLTQGIKKPADIPDE